MHVALEIGGACISLAIKTAGNVNWDMLWRLYKIIKLELNCCMKGMDIRKRISQIQQSGGNAPKGTLQLQGFVDNK